MKKILTIGEILVEVMAVEPGNGFREAISLVGPYPSGAPAIFIDQAARFGQPSAMIGCVGRDDFGTVCVDRLMQDGVDVGAVSEDLERPTGSAFVRYRPDGARDFVFNIRHSACSSIKPTAQTDAAIAACDHLHVMGTSLFSERIIALTLDAIHKVRARGGTISFDPNIRREMLDLPGLREALDWVAGQTDLFLPSGPELFLFTDAQVEQDAVNSMLARGMRAIVVKRGAEGASYFDGETTASVAAHRTEEIDPTAPATASARPSSRVGYAARLPRRHWPMPMPQERWPCARKVRWKARRRARKSRHCSRRELPETRGLLRELLPEFGVKSV
jgi:tagatose kinase